MELFRHLTETEKEEFRQWARDNYDRTVHPSGLWHPVLLEEWNRLAMADLADLAGQVSK